MSFNCSFVDIRTGRWADEWQRTFRFQEIEPTKKAGVSVSAPFGVVSVGQFGHQDEIGGLPMPPVERVAA